MKYFAMIDGRQHGPFSLDDLVKEGVRPDTYVWCKGMDDWAMASDVPDICRYFRQRLSGSLPSMRVSPAQAEEQCRMADEEEQQKMLQELPPMARNLIRRSGVRLTRNELPEQQHRRYPAALPVILYIICLTLILLGFMLK